MTVAAWLDVLTNQVRPQIPLVEVSPVDDDTVTYAFGTRGVVVHVTGDIALVALSIASGSSIASRLENRVQHLDPTSYALTEEAAKAAATAIGEHLSGSERSESQG